MTPRQYAALWLGFGVLFLVGQFVVVKWAIVAAIRAYVAGS